VVILTNISETKLKCHVMIQCNKKIYCQSTTNAWTWQYLMGARCNKVVAVTPKLQGATYIHLPNFTQWSFMEDITLFFTFFLHHVHWRQLLCPKTLHHIWKFAIFKVEFTNDIWIKRVGELPKTTYPFKDISLLKIGHFSHRFSQR
jgi:hypothetical protein